MPSFLFLIISEKNLPYQFSWRIPPKFKQVRIVTQWIQLPSFVVIGWVVPILLCKQILLIRTKAMNMGLIPGKVIMYISSDVFFLNPKSILMVSWQKGPNCHAYAWQIGPFWQDTLDMRLNKKSFIMRSKSQRQWMGTGRWEWNQNINKSSQTGGTWLIFKRKKK